jgi:hypothetical protein
VVCCLKEDFLIRINVLEFTCFTIENDIIVEKNVTNSILFDPSGRKALKVEILNCLGVASFSLFLVLSARPTSQLAQQNAIDQSLACFGAAYDIDSCNIVAIVNKVEHF